MSGSDVVVVGAGVMGAWTALRCRRAGWPTTLIDAYGVGHPRATSGDETRILRSSHGADAFYARWARESRTAWRQFGDEVGQQLFHEVGMLWFARQEDGFEARSLATLEALGIPSPGCRPTSCVRCWPQIGVEGLAFATYEPEAGLVMADPVSPPWSGRSARTAAAWSSQTCALVGSRAIGSSTWSAPTGTRHPGDTFVFAAGPWLPTLFPDLLGPLVTVTKQDVVFLGHAPGTVASGRSGCRAGSTTTAATTGAGGRRSRREDRPRPRRAAVRPDRRRAAHRPGHLRQVRAYARGRFPALASAPVVETRVCQYETTPDTEFILDRHPPGQRLDRRRRLRARVQARPGHRELPGVTPGRGAGESGGGEVLIDAPSDIRLAPANGGAVRGYSVAGPVKSLRRFIVYGERSVASGKIEASSAVAAIQSTRSRLTMTVSTSRASTAPATL